MPHRYLRQHQSLLLPLLLLPHLALVHTAVEDSLSLHAVLVHLTVRSNCPDEQRQCLFFLLQLHLQTLVLLLHLGELLWNLVLVLISLLEVIGMDDAAEYRLFVRDRASSLLLQVERRVHSGSALLPFLLILLDCLQCLLSLRSLLLCLLRLAHRGVTIVIQIQQRNIPQILQTLLAINHNIALLSDNIGKMPIFQRQYLHQRYISIQHQIRFRLPCLTLIQRYTLLPTLILLLDRISLIGLIRRFHIRSRHRIRLIRRYPFIPVLELPIIIIDLFLFLPNPSLLLHFLHLFLPPLLLHLAIKLRPHLPPLPLHLVLLIVKEFLREQPAIVAANLELLHFLFVKHNKLILL